MLKFNSITIGMFLFIRSINQQLHHISPIHYRSVVGLKQILNQDLGIESEISKLFVKVLYDKLTESNTIFGTMLFNDWRRVFQQTCGYFPRKLKGIEKNTVLLRKLLIMNHYCLRCIRTWL